MVDSSVVMFPAHKYVIGRVILEAGLTYIASLVCGTGAIRIVKISNWMSLKFLFSFSQDIKSEAKPGGIIKIGAILKKLQVWLSLSY